MMVQSSIPVLRVADYPAARAFWTDVMGFSIAEEGGDPARFGIFKRDAAVVFVDGWHDADPEPCPVWRAYFHVEAAADVVEQVSGSAPVEGPVDTVYGMREVTVTDPSGNRLCFGQDVQ
jgi:catechol 2,3-dioxygenase-like lactoylglutathione lyase family enzyme